MNVRTVDSPSQRMFCPKCGTRTEPNAAFCPNCGNHFDAPPMSTHTTHGYGAQAAAPARPVTSRPVLTKRFIVMGVTTLVILLSLFMPWLKVPPMSMLEYKTVNKIEETDREEYNEKMPKELRKSSMSLLRTKSLLDEVSSKVDILYDSGILSPMREFGIDVMPDADEAEEGFGSASTVVLVFFIALIASVLLLVAALVMKFLLDKEQSPLFIAGFAMAIGVALLWIIGVSMKNGQLASAALETMGLWIPEDIGISLKDLGLEIILTFFKPALAPFLTLISGVVGLLAFLQPRFSKAPVS